MAQSKTAKATGSGGKTSTGSARTTVGSGAKSGTGSARKPSTGSAGKATAGPARKAATGSARKTATGPAGKAADSGTKSGTGSARKPSTGSAGKATAGPARKATTGSARKTATRPARRSGTGSADKVSTGSTRRANGSSRDTGIYVYGILPADVEVTSDETLGVGDPPGQVRLVRSDGLAALVSDVSLSGQLGSPDDLTAHKEILDACAAELPVLPMRFGAVMTSEDAVADELLAANHDEFADALDELDGRLQYVIKGRYVDETILNEILSENTRAARLRDKIHGKNADATRDERIKLGEIINQAVTAKRQEDTRVLGEAMEGQCAASVVREPTHELDAVHVAFLVDADREREIEQVIDDLARDWEGRIELRLLGPMAAYDFAGTAEPED
jgi:Gas vesicle synthesis protein GvpL/GvpF